MGWIEGFVTIVGLAAITLVTRGFFFFSSRPPPIPRQILWALRAAPLAAMAAVVVPQIVVTEAGAMVNTWQDARLWGTAAAAAWFFWRRSLLGTIVAGMGVYLCLRLAMGW